MKRSLHCIQSRFSDYQRLLVRLATAVGPNHFKVSSLSFGFDKKSTPGEIVLMQPRYRRRLSKKKVNFLTICDRLTDG